MFTLSSSRQGALRREIQSFVARHESETGLPAATISNFAESSCLSEDFKSHTGKPGRLNSFHVIFAASPQLLDEEQIGLERQNARERVGRTPVTIHVGVDICGDNAHYPTLRLPTCALWQS
jgi:hypothetical protein